MHDLRQVCKRWELQYPTLRVAGTSSRSSQIIKYIPPKIVISNSADKRHGPRPVLQRLTRATAVRHTAGPNRNTRWFVHGRRATERMKTTTGDGRFFLRDAHKKPLEIRCSGNVEGIYSSGCHHQPKEEDAEHQAEWRRDRKEPVRTPWVKTI